MVDVLVFVVARHRCDQVLVSHNEATARLAESTSGWRWHHAQAAAASLASQLVIVQLIMIIAVLVAVSAVSVEQTRVSFQRDQGRRVLVLAEVLAASPIVRAGVVDPDGSSLPAATTQLQTTTGVELVIIASTRGVVMAGTDPLLVDEPLDWPGLAATPERSHSAAIEIEVRGIWWPPRRSCRPRTTAIRYVSLVSPWSGSRIRPGSSHWLARRLRW